MTWRTSSPVIWARSVARFTGVHRPLMRLLQSARYEDRFGRAMSSAIEPGDCVWDVGANVGSYSLTFAERVGPAGHVLAFEPSSSTFAELQARVGRLPNVTALCLALGAETGSAAFEQGDDPLGATSRITESASPTAARVPIARGHELVERGTARRPNIIKIDTEGHELEVLSGLGELLFDPDLRLLGVEVHFGLLAQRGHPHAPEQIEKTLERARFQVSWADASHIVARRNSR